MENEDQPAAGWTVPGYTHDRELGSGASGLVVGAREDATGTAVAIKYLNQELCDDPAFRKRFQEEARLLAKLRSPSVAQLYEFVVNPAGMAIIMELVDGISLRTLLSIEGIVSPEASLTLLKGSLLGLAAAHARGVVHRDYKPENILVSLNGSSKLVDFGIAVPNGAVAEIAGTPSYMAPEQWRGQPATPATDVYAATATFFECLTGTKPYSGSTTTALAVQHAESPIPVHQVPEPLRSLIYRGMAKTPVERPESATAFLHDLEMIASVAYGAEWEDRGQRKLAALTALLPLLFPFTTGPSSAGTALATTSLNQPGRAVYQRASTDSISIRRRWRRPSVYLAGAGAIATFIGAAIVTAPSHDRGSATSPVVGVAPTAMSSSVVPSAGGPSTSSAASANVTELSTPSEAPGSGAVPSPSISAPDATETTVGPRTTVSPQADPGTPSASPTFATGEPLPSTSPARTVHVLSVNITNVDCKGSRGDASITVHTNGVAGGSLNLTWLSGDRPEPQGSHVEDVQTFPLPEGENSVYISAHHSFAGENWWGAMVSTSPDADSGERSYKFLDAFVCDPPR
ncbi:protein kinase [Streptomyces sp. NBC_00289]|uniref:protein kinase domain-containing protein n=1 Tax=Streptomyces sp. NBC_00289 TaxID=2975703 RepID=UPI00352FEAB2